jgi:hypothetical protein
LSGVASASIAGECYRRSGIEEVLVNTGARKRAIYAVARARSRGIRRGTALHPARLELRVRDAAIACLTRVALAEAGAGWHVSHIGKEIAGSSAKAAALLRGRVATALAALDSVVDTADGLLLLNLDGR